MKYQNIIQVGAQHSKDRGCASQRRINFNHWQQLQNFICKSFGSHSEVFIIFSFTSDFDCSYITIPQMLFSFFFFFHTVPFFWSSKHQLFANNIEILQLRHTKLEVSPEHKTILIFFFLYRYGFKIVLFNNALSQPEDLI